MPIPFVLDQHAKTPLWLPQCVFWSAASRFPTTADGAVLPTIYNLANPANNATQGTGAQQATFQSDSASLIAGKPVILTDGSDAYALASSIVLGDYTSIYVGKNVGANQAFWGGDLTSGIGMIHNDYGPFYNYAGVFDDMSAYMSAVVEIVVVRRRAGVHQVWVNGEDKTLASTNNTTAITIKYLWKDDNSGTPRYVDVTTCAEMALFAAALDDSQWRWYVNLLGNTYNIPVK